MNTAFNALGSSSLRSAEFESKDMTDEMLIEAAQLFSEHYGIWNAPEYKRGIPTPMSASRLRRSYLPVGAYSSYVCVHVDGTLAGHAFACRWTYHGRRVCWVTQLVVHRDFRERRLATRLLEKLRKNDDEVFGIMSSHPAACIALSKACSEFSFPHVPLGFMQTCAREVMAGSPISYVRDAKLCGSLFQPDGASHLGLVSGVDTNFFVDHEEPLSALEWLQAEGLWPLGSLPDGHEFLLVFEVSRRRSRRRAFRRGVSPCQEFRRGV
ncbi:hypothetical protein MYCTH_2058169 [Thermothelomyces thermophilus ATCC 42464]|uniref:N-acetyltransferase domain-containing protein n=1 Tax=Thermothelomyces thermophilus (strain ATCC 42464 / BCRC 31852 / DSM 1799) TaxID=573729 RepID=G2Q916_THET4|nr:uncharacterized protein MYCTH_2058169 [Thermothelomyces thermophilus ATCC 42464]AEO57160.1 hypothetical protein MYCTH_2058169 [Thermothelomyces thermophilus ATCC 42464]